MKGLIFLACFWFLVGLTLTTCRAENNILDSLITVALNNNPDIQAAEGYYKSADFTSRAVATLPDPQFSISVVNLPQRSLALNTTPMSGVVFGLSQKLPWPGKLSTRSSLARTDYNIAGQKARIIKNRIVRETSNAYYEYSYWKFAEKVILENLDLVDALVKTAEIRYANGIITARDLFQAQSTHTRLEIRFLNARRQILTQKLELTRALGDDSGINEIPASLPDTVDMPKAIDWKEASPYIKTAELNVDMAATRLSLSRSEYWPDFTIGVDYRFRETIPGDPAAGEDFLSFKLGFSLPLWFFAKQNNNVKAAIQQLAAVRQYARSAAQMTLQQIDDTRQTLATIGESLNKYDSDLIPQARAAYETAIIAYENGQIDFDALLLSQMNLLELSLERLELIKQIQQNKAFLLELYGVDYEKQI